MQMLHYDLDPTEITKCPVGDNTDAVAITYIIPLSLM
jgi:hypothetical protein